MTDKLTIFDFANNEIRVMQDENGEPRFVAKDVAAILGYSETNVMLKRLEDEDKYRSVLPTLGGNQEMIVINESGLYEAIFGSQKSVAKLFKKWVTSEVLPSIRKTGSYGKQITMDNVLDNKELLLKLLTESIDKDKELESKNLLLIEQKPKVDTYDKIVGDTDSLYPIREVAKIIFNDQKGKHVIGGTLLSRAMVNDGILVVIDKNKLPSQTYIKQQLFVTKYIQVEHINKLVPQVFVTGKGLIWLKNKYNPVKA